MLFCLQVFWALQLVTVLVPGAAFHLYAACKNIDQEEILQRPIYTVFYIISVLLRIILEVIAFWLQSHLFGFQVHPLYMCDASALEKTFNITKCMVPEHFEKTIFLSAMYTFTGITVLLCVAEIFEILCRRLGYLTNQWPVCYLLQSNWSHFKCLCVYPGLTWTPMPKTTYLCFFLLGVDTQTLLSIIPLFKSSHTDLNLILSID